MRVFFTGAFRKPRELNWLIGVGLLVARHRRGLRRLLPARRPALRHRRCASPTRSRCRSPSSAPGPRSSSSAASTPATAMLDRLYAGAHPALPGVILGLITVHMMMVWYQKHTQFAGPGRTEDNVVGSRLLPRLRGQGRRLLLPRLRRAGGPRRPGADQPHLAVRPVQPVPGVGRLAARLVHRLPRRLDAPHAELGVSGSGLHVPLERADPDAWCCRASCSRLLAVYPFLEAQLHRRPGVPQPARPAARQARSAPPRRHVDHLLPGAPGRRRQRHHRLDLPTCRSTR